MATQDKDTIPLQELIKRENSITRLSGREKYAVSKLAFRKGPSCPPTPGADPGLLPLPKEELCLQGLGWLSSHLVHPLPLKAFLFGLCQSHDHT